MLTWPNGVKALVGCSLTLITELGTQHDRKAGNDIDDFRRLQCLKMVENGVEEARDPTAVVY
jgi:hypothetical protein